jgi:hypothetical protein
MEMETFEAYTVLLKGVDEAYKNTNVNSVTTETYH